ncbi:MAG TPA: hypothetical protein VEP90_06500 [Methylomirabilota bacterium]|nr:hypothetical protein [Methylomirabilota bacterium]
MVDRLALLEFIAAGLAAAIAGIHWGWDVGIMVYLIIFVLYQPGKRW